MAGEGQTSAAADDLAPAVRGYLQHLVVERGLAANTLASYQRDLHRYVTALSAAGITHPGAITEVDVAAVVRNLRHGDDDHPPLSASSAGRALVAIRGLHRFLLREGIVAADVAHEIRPPTLPRRLPKAIPFAEVERLLDVSSRNDSPLGLRNRALLEMLYGTGARISEAVGLDRDDVDSASSTILLRGKGGKERTVPVGSYARAAVEAYLVRARPELARTGRGTAALFLNARGGRLSRQSAWTVLRDVAERAGLASRVSPHTLRHSFATHLIDGGADVRVVQELLGHASVTTTQVYTLVTVDRLREVYATSHPRAR